MYVVSIQPTQGPPVLKNQQKGQTMNQLSSSRPKSPSSQLTFRFPPVSGPEGEGSPLSHLQKTCFEFLRRNLLTDTTVYIGKFEYVEKGRISWNEPCSILRCHKLVLSAYSNYFYNKFVTLKKNRIFLDARDVSLQNFVRIMDFIYKGKVTVSQDDLEGFRECARKLEVQLLLKDIDRHLNSQQQNATRALNLVDVKLEVDEDDDTPGSSGTSPIPMESEGKGGSMQFDSSRLPPNMELTVVKRQPWKIGPLPQSSPPTEDPSQVPETRAPLNPTGNLSQVLQTRALNPTGNLSQVLQTRAPLNPSGNLSQVPQTRAPLHPTGNQNRPIDSITSEKYHHRMIPLGKKTTPGMYQRSSEMPPNPPRRLPSRFEEAVAIPARASQNRSSSSPKKSPSSTYLGFPYQRKYTEEQMQAAIDQVINERATISSAARSYKVPRSTLTNRLRRQGHGKINICGQKSV